MRTQQERSELLEKYRFDDPCLQAFTQMYGPLKYATATDLLDIIIFMSERYQHMTKIEVERRIWEFPHG